MAEGGSRREDGRGTGHGIAGGISLLLHAIAISVVLLAPVLTPAPPLPAPGEVLVRLIYNPPAPPPPPLPRGSALRPSRAQPEPARPVVDRPEPFTAPVVLPRPDEDEHRAAPGVTAEQQFGSETGSDKGDALGSEGGVDGGVPGGVPGGVIGGVPGGSGDGPVFDYDAPPRLVRRMSPVYPHDAFVKKVEGEVLLEIVIDPAGHVVRARVLRSIPLLDAAAIACVNEWLFQPAVKHGRPVLTLAHAPVRFRIL